MDILLSVILVTHNAEATILDTLAGLRSALASEVSDYEIIVVDNASSDATVARLEQATAEWSDIQVYCCASEVNLDIARLAGLEQAIGDYVLIFDPERDDCRRINDILKAAADGAELVLACNRNVGKHGGVFYRMFSHAFIRMFRGMSGLDLRADAPHFRLMTRQLVNYVLQHENAYTTYQLLPVLAGFKIGRLDYESPVPIIKRQRRPVGDILNRAVSLTVSTSAAPLRLVTCVCALASLLSLLSSCYVLVVYFIKEDVAPGWTTLSLQLSVQFFLIAMAIALLSEYVLQISRQTNRRPKYYIVREFRSNQMTRALKLNLRPEG